MKNLLFLAFVVAASANLSKLADDVCHQDLRRKLCQKRFPKSVGLCMATHPNLNYLDHTNSVYLTGTNPANALKIDDLCPWLNLAEATTSPPPTTTVLPFSLTLSRIREDDDLSDVTRPDSRRPTQTPATLKPRFVRGPDVDTELDRPQQDSNNRKYELCDLELRQSQKQRVVLQERWSNCSLAYTESVRDQESTLAKLDDCTEKLQEGQTNNQAAFRRVSESEAECKKSLVECKDLTQDLQHTNDKHLRTIAASQASTNLLQKLKSHAERDLEVCIEKTDEANHQLGICEADKVEAQSAATAAQRCRKEMADLGDRLTSDVQTCQHQKASLENRVSSLTSHCQKEKDDFVKRLTQCQDDVANVTSSNSITTKELSSCRSNLDDAARAKSNLESAGEINKENLEKLADRYDRCADDSRRLQAKVTKMHDDLVLCEEQKTDMQYTLVQAEALLNKTEAGETALTTTARAETTTAQPETTTPHPKTITDESNQCRSTLKATKEEKDELTLLIKSCNGHLSSCKTERSALQISVNMTRPCLSEKAQVQSQLNVCRDGLEEANQKLNKANQELDVHREQGFDMKLVNATTELQRCYKALNDALGAPVESKTLQDIRSLAEMPELNNYISLSQKSSACSGNSVKPNPPMWLNPAHLWTAIGLLTLACFCLTGVLIWIEHLSKMCKSPNQDDSQPAEPAQVRPPAAQSQPKVPEAVSAGRDLVEIHV